MGRLVIILKRYKMKLYIHYWNGDFIKRFNFPQFETTFYEKWPTFTKINPYSVSFTSNTCKVFDTTERRFTSDGDLSDYIEDYPESSGILLKSGQLAKMSIFTPHECIKQTKSGNRQFIRIVGEGVEGREDYFTVNPLI